MVMRRMTKQSQYNCMLTVHIGWLNSAPVLQLVGDRGLHSPACARIALVYRVAVTAEGCVRALLEAFWEDVVVSSSVNHAALVWKTELGHVSKHVKDISSVAAVAETVISTTVQQSLTG